MAVYQIDDLISELQALVPMTQYIDQRLCESCQQLFIAEGEKSPSGKWLFNPLCDRCDEDLHEQVDDILKERGF